MPYILNRNAGMDILHVEHPFEECNVDDANGVELIDDETAEALLAIDEARRCEHCRPLADS